MARSGISCLIPYGGYGHYSMTCSVDDDDLGRWCDAERAMLDDAMAAERAMLDAHCSAQLALLDAIGGIVKPGSTTRAARRMTVKRCNAGLVS